jgi:hypothetical protein
MAAPVVTAVASLAWSVNPQLTGKQVKAIVCDAANTRYSVPETNDKFWVSVSYKNYDMVNAKLAVEAAVKTLYDTGKITGKAVDAFDNGKICEIKAVCGDKEFIFSCSADGNFDFILPPGEAVLTFYGNDFSPVTNTMQVTKNTSLDLGDVILI